MKPKTYEVSKTAEDIWAKLLPVIGESLSIVALKTWFENVIPVSLEGNVFTIAVCDSTRQDIITSRFSKDVCTALYDLFCEEITLQVILHEQINQPTEEKEKIKDPVHKKYTFDNFVVGESNRYAYAYAKGVASQEFADVNSNPLFIYGNSGLGKTHLLHAISNRVEENYPDRKVIYCTSENWFTELLESISNKTNNQFREKYRNMDLLIIDDVQFFAKSQSGQEELFNTFNDLYDLNKQIVFTSDRPPSELLKIEDRLTSRFASGLTVDIKSPDYDTRLAIIKNKTEARGIKLPISILELIADNIKKNVRLIEGTINQILGYRDFSEIGNNELSEDIKVQGENIPSDESIMKIVRDILNNRSQIIPTPDVIIKQVAKCYDISEEEMKGQGRAQKIVTPRSIAIYLIREMTGLPLAKIGEEFSGRDHTTIMHACNSLEIKMQKDRKLQIMVEDIQKNINELYE